MEVGANLPSRREESRVAYAAQPKTRRLSRFRSDGSEPVHKQNGIRPFLFVRGNLFNKYTAVFTASVHKDGGTRPPTSKQRVFSSIEQ